eukprot:2457197-Pyramimonas_sp.AAC.1
MNSIAAPSTFRNHVFAVDFPTIDLGIELSLEASSRFMQDARFSSPLVPSFPTRLFVSTRPMC